MPLGGFETNVGSAEAITPRGASKMVNKVREHMLNIFERVYTAKRINPISSNIDFDRGGRGLFI